MLLLILFPFVGLALAWPVAGFLRETSTDALGGRLWARVVLGAGVVPFLLALVWCPVVATRHVAFKRSLMDEHSSERAVTVSSAVALHDFVARNLGREVGYDTAIWLCAALVPLVFAPASLALALTLWSRRRSWGIAARVLTLLPWLAVLVVLGAIASGGS